MIASLAPKTPLARRVSLRLAAPGLRPNARPDLARSLRMAAEAVAAWVSTRAQPGSMLGQFGMPASISSGASA
jgi:hypothetical protein